MASKLEIFKNYMRKLYAERVKSRSINSSMEDYNVNKSFTDYDQENENEQANINRGLLEQARKPESPLDKYNAEHPPKTEFEGALRRLLKKKAEDAGNYYPQAEDKMY